jgi:hypothetical protein
MAGAYIYTEGSGVGAKIGKADGRNVSLPAGYRVGFFEVMPTVGLLGAMVGAAVGAVVGVVDEAHPPGIDGGVTPPPGIFELYALPAMVWAMVGAAVGAVVGVVDDAHPPGIGGGVRLCFRFRVGDCVGS